MKCLACWEEIEEGEKVCNQCGSNQEDVKDFLTLALMAQQKKKITVAEKSPILQYIFDLDPSTKEEITISSSAATSVTQTPESQPSQTYSPSKPTWLSTPETDDKKTEIEKSRKQDTKIKTIRCPECEKEVPLKKYCKYCGTQLQKACSNCEKLNLVNSKFCTSCGEAINIES